MTPVFSGKSAFLPWLCQLWNWEGTPPSMSKGIGTSWALCMDREEYWRFRKYYRAGAGVHPKLTSLCSELGGTELGLKNRRTPLLSWQLVRARMEPGLRAEVGTRVQGHGERCRDHSTLGACSLVAGQCTGPNGVATEGPQFPEGTHKDRPESFRTSA